ncbi:MAG: hypothetical protein U0790_13125 [Isosphaeraceae bacterium]
MSTYDPDTSGWTHQSYPGWSTANNLTYGGIDLSGQYVFVTDTFTYGGEDRGLVRFDTATGTAERFAADYDFWDLDVGPDGLVYGLTGSEVRVYDPATLELVKAVALPGYSDNNREVAVDSSGDLYIGTLDQQILHYDPDATTLKGSLLLTYGLYDMDIASDGRIVTGAWGTMTLTDTSLSWQSNISINSAGPVFVAFGHIPTAGGPYWAEEGGSVTLDGSNALLAGEDPAGSKFEWDLDYDGVTFDTDETGIQATLSFLDDVPARTIALRVTNTSGGVRVLTTTLEVLNAAPTITSFTSSSPVLGGAVEGKPVSVSASFTDPGVQDKFTATIDWGDGSPPESFGYAPGTTTLTEKHVYADGGSYVISISLSDHDGGVAFAQTQAIVSGVRLNGTVLEVYGTNAADTLTMSLANDTTARVRGSFINGTKTFDLVWVDRISVVLGGGDDRATISSGITRPTLIDGGAGNDNLTAGGGPTILIGGTGNDGLTGGKGRNLMIGGLGLDSLSGNAGEDILIGGTTSYDADYAALWSLEEQWNGPGDFWSRTSQLRYSLNTTTVFDDGQVDTLTGGKDLDWFFAGYRDRTDDAKV